MLKRRKEILIIFMAGCLCLAMSAAAEVVDRVVAIVNDEIISLSEVDQLTKIVQAQTGMSPKSKDKKALERQVLETLIDQKLARGEAKRRGITVSDKELEQALDDFKKRNNLLSQEALEQALAKSGMTLKELKQKISDQIIQDRLVAIAVGGKVTPVSEAEMRRFYETEYPKEAGRGQRVHLKIIELPFPSQATAAQKEEIRKKAEEIVQSAGKGGSLEATAAKYSLKVKDLGFISANDLNPQLAAALEKLKPGEVAPIQTPAGFQFMQVVARKSGDQVRSYEEVAPQIRSFLMRQAMDKRFTEWVKTLRQKAVIKIML
jgi:peptidyl-prolyl cis-trans isomerase SurA